MQKTICKILTAILICVMVLGIPVAAAQQTAAEEPKSRVDAWNLVLAGDIAVNFLVEISDEVSADAVMEITDGYGITAYPINTLEPDANGRYLFTAHLAAAQMADSIYLRLIDGGQVVSTHTYRATQYAQAVLGGNYSPAVKKLLSSMLHYGASAQVYFNYRTDNLANAGLEAAPAPQLPECTGGHYTTGEISDVSYYGASLLMNSQVAVRFYFTADSVEGCSFRTADGKTYTAKYKSGMYYVEVPGINPQDYDKMVTLSVSKGDQQLQVQYSPMTYILNKYASTENSALKAMTAAMYQYHLDAIAFLDASGQVVTDGNGIVTEEVVITNGKNSAVVSAGTQLKENTTSLTLTATVMDASGSDIVPTDNELMVAMDVHMEGISSENTVPVVVTLDKLAPEFLNNGNITLYHVENGVTNRMTRVSSPEELDAHNEYYYDIATGTIRVAMATFSEVTVVANAVNAWNGDYDYSWYDVNAAEYTIANADQLAGFGRIVGGMAVGIARDDFQGKTVKLLSDIDLGDAEANNVEGKVFYPIGYFFTTDKNGDNKQGDIYSTVYAFRGTFDGAGHTVSNFYHNTWEMKGDYSGSSQYYNDAMGLFGYVVGGDPQAAEQEIATVKNLTIRNFSSDGEFAPTGVVAAYAKGNVVFENISLLDCNPRTYNTGVAGIVGWDDGGDAQNDPNENTHYTFRNITIDNSNTISALWGSWDVGAAGVLGYLGPYSTADFDNCHIAAKIDVNNDVCANYQYYWYRYCGMLIGTVDRTKTENGYTVLDLTGIRANNTTVNFGDWNDYYYCELVANSLASYTYDHQFSRLTEVSSVEEMVTTGTHHYVIVDRTTEPKTATCYHFINGVPHQHSASLYETTDVNGDGIIDNTLPKEDKTLVNLPFNQVFGGYGWGVKGTQASELGIAVSGITQGTTVSSTERFAPKSETIQIIAPGTTLEAGSLFEALTDDINDVAVQIAVTDPEGKVTVEYVANKKDWTKSTLTFHGRGTVQITIQDYYYCLPTTITLVVENFELEGFDILRWTGDLGIYTPANRTETISVEKLTQDGDRYYVVHMFAEKESIKEEADTYYRGVDIPIDMSKLQNLGDVDYLQAELKTVNMYSNEISYNLLDKDGNVLGRDSTQLVRTANYSVLRMNLDAMGITEEELSQVATIRISANWHHQTIYVNEGYRGRGDVYIDSLVFGSNKEDSDDLLDHIHSTMLENWWWGCFNFYDNAGWLLKENEDGTYLDLYRVKDMNTSDDGYSPRRSHWEFTQPVPIVEKQTVNITVTNQNMGTGSRLALWCTWIEEGQKKEGYWGYLNLNKPDTHHYSISVSDLYRLEITDDSNNNLVQTTEKLDVAAAIEKNMQIKGVVIAGDYFNGVSTQSGHLILDDLYFGTEVNALEDQLAYSPGVRRPTNGLQNGFVLEMLDSFEGYENVFHINADPFKNGAALHNWPDQVSYYVGKSGDWVDTTEYDYFTYTFKGVGHYMDLSVDFLDKDGNSLGAYGSMRTSNLRSDWLTFRISLKAAGLTADALKQIDRVVFSVNWRYQNPNDESAPTYELDLYFRDCGFGKLDEESTDWMDRISDIRNPGYWQGGFNEYIDCGWRFDENGTFTFYRSQTTTGMGYGLRNMHVYFQTPITVKSGDRITLDVNNTNFKTAKVEVISLIDGKEVFYTFGSVASRNESQLSICVDNLKTADGAEFDPETMTIIGLRFHINYNATETYDPAAAGTIAFKNLYVLPAEE